MRKLKSISLVILVVLSMFAFIGFTTPVLAEEPLGPGWHEMTVNYYQAYIYDDHDGGLAGAGEWYFRLYGGGEWTYYVFKSRDGPGYADFSDRIRIYDIHSDTYFQCQAREEDTFGWDYTSTLQVNVAFPGTSLNVWHSGNYKVGDVRHYYQFKIENLVPTVGSISGPSSGYRKVAYTFTASGSDPDGDSITYQWKVDGVTQSATDSSLTYTFPTSAALGSHVISVRTRDYFGLYSTERTTSFTIYNRAPTVSSISGPSSGYPGVPYTFSAIGSDPDGDSITYQWSVDWVTQPATGSSLTYTFPDAGTYTVRVRTKDSHGTYSSYSTKTVTIITASISIWADKTSYHIGDPMKVYVRVKNPGPALPVRVTIQVQKPDGSMYGPLLDLTTTLPASFDSGNVLWNSFVIPAGAPLGNYAWIAELRNPTTNALVSRSTWDWMLWP